MKRVIALLLVYILPALCLAQTSANHQLPDDIKVLEASWHHGVDWRNPSAGSPERQLEQRRANNKLGPLDTEQTLFLRGDRNAAVVTIRNEGSKTIKALSPPGVNPTTGVNSEIRVVINRIEYADGSTWRRR